MEKVWVEIKNGLPRSAIGQRPSLGEFEAYVPQQQLDQLRAALGQLALEWRTEAEVPAPHEMENALLLKTCAKELENLLAKP